MYCGQASLVKADWHSVEAKVLRCRSWNCDVCKETRRNGLIAEAIGGRPNRFITLTYRADTGEDKAAIVKKLSRAWRLIRKRLEREGKSRVEFLAVVELTPGKKTPHLHITARCQWIDQRKLSVLMAELADAPIVDIRKIDQETNVAAYVAKYIGEETAKVGTCKRYWKSKGYDLRSQAERDRPPPVFCYTDQVQVEIHAVARSYKRLGYAIEWLSRDHFVGACEAQPWHDGGDRRGDVDRITGPPAGGALRATSQRSDLTPC